MWICNCVLIAFPSLARCRLLFLRKLSAISNFLQLKTVVLGNFEAFLILAAIWNNILICSSLAGTKFPLGLSPQSNCFLHSLLCFSHIIFGKDHLGFFLALQSGECSVSQKHLEISSEKLLLCKGLGTWQCLWSFLVSQQGFGEHFFTRSR